jgi:hypothetical protein
VPPFLRVKIVEAVRAHGALTPELTKIILDGEP